MTVAVVGNTKLIEYGILQEKSDIRAHVSVRGQRVYVYPTENARKAIQAKAYKKKEVITRNIVTGVGWLVPWNEIERCQWVEVSKQQMSLLRFRETDSTSDKGFKAVQVVRWLLKQGLFPLWLNSQMIDDSQMQLSGTDIRVMLDTQMHIQVKCDWKCGSGPGCTGNLFNQEQECNPFRQY